MCESVKNEILYSLLHYILMVYKINRHTHRNAQDMPGYPIVRQGFLVKKKMTQLFRKRSVSLFKLTANCNLINHINQVVRFIHIRFRLTFF